VNVKFTANTSTNRKDLQSQSPLPKVKNIIAVMSARRVGKSTLRLKKSMRGSDRAFDGPERVKQTIKEALAKAGPAAFTLWSDNFAQLDPLGSAKALAAAIRKEKADLVLTGLQERRPRLRANRRVVAGLLDLPHATIIMAIEVTDGEMRLKRELEADGFNISSAPAAVLSIQSGINKVRYATLKASWRPRRKRCPDDAGVARRFCRSDAED